MFDDPCKKVRIVEEGCGPGKLSVPREDLTLETIVSDFIIFIRERGIQENNFNNNQQKSTRS